MDIIKEINKLPNYYYEFSVSPYCAILGSSSCKKVDNYDRMIISPVQRWLRQMNSIFEKESLDIQDKEDIAQLASKIGAYCNERLETHYTAQQQETFIQTLPQSAKDELEHQIIRYEQAREYYRDYVFKC